MWLTLECFRRNSFKNRSIGLVELVDCLKNDQKWSWFCLEVGVAPKNSRTLRAQQYQNPPSKNPGSATGAPNIIDVYNYIMYMCALHNHIVPKACTL